jgi:hypothetical protein
VWSDEHSQPYWHNNQTNETTWTQPPELNL